MAANVRICRKSGHWIASPENAEAIFSIEDT